MASRPDRRTFLRGAAGAVGMGAVGAFSSKLEFMRAAEAFPADTVTIPVFLVPQGKLKEKGRQRMKILVPPSAAEAGDDVVWEARDGVQCIKSIKFLPDSPFATLNIIGACSTAKRNAQGSVRSDAAKKRYTYKIQVTGSNGRPYTKDPDLDII